MRAAGLLLAFLGAASADPLSWLHTPIALRDAGKFPLQLASAASAAAFSAPRSPPLRRGADAARALESASGDAGSGDDSGSCDLEGGSGDVDGGSGDYGSGDGGKSKGDGADDGSGDLDGGSGDYGSGTICLLYTSPSPRDS